MKSVTQCLQPSDIEALLAGTAQASQIELWEEHFSSCESCRMAMASQVGDPKWWHEAEQSLLQPVGESLQVSQIRLGEPVQRELSDEPESLEELLKLLGPTDDPKFMGRIGTYEVLGVLGRGGMGIVFKAFDAPLNRFVAIKMLLPHLAASGAARKRFAREGQAAAAVVDDYVLPIYAVSEWKGVPYLVTQYSRGTTLQKRVQSEGPLEVKEILRLGMQTARGLAAAHAQGLVHRDVKPSNILLDGSVERAMLTDFGLARAVDDASITRTGVIAGTPQYMSPEQARGGSVDARSDLFSLGCVLYFLCTGHPPFRADNSYAILRLITDEEPRSIREINPDIPAWLCSAVQKLMAKKAEDRYGSASEVADILEECLAHVSNPLKNPLPLEPEALAELAFTQPPSASRFGNRLTPQAQDHLAGASHSFHRFLWGTFMNDNRILSMVALGLFIAAFLLPWPIAAIGRDEHAMIFAGVSMLLALSFAVMSRRESFSRIVLVTVGGVLGLLLIGVLISVPIFFFRSNQAVNESRLLEQRHVEEAKRAAEDVRRAVEQESAMVNQNLQGSVGKTEPLLTDQRSSNSETRQTLAEAVKAFNEHSPKKTVTVEIPIDISKHPREMLEKNLNHQGLSLYAAGVMTRAEGSEVNAPATVVIAHDCTLRAFEEVERNGEKFWNTTLVVPMQNELLDLRPGMTLEEAEAKFDPKAFQDRLHKWRMDGAKFELDHYLGQEPKPSRGEGQVQPETEKTDSPKAAVPTEETPKEMPGDNDTTGADGQEGSEPNQVATTPVQADVASVNSEVPESAAPANPDATRFLGQWRLAHTFHHSTLPADAPSVISPASIVIGSSDDHGPHKFSYTLRGEQEIDLRLYGQDGLSAPLLGRYQFQENRLFIAFNNSPDAKERPQNATMEDPAKDVALMIFEFVATIDEGAAASPGQ